MNNNLINGFSVIMPLYCNENPDNFIQSMNSLLNQTLCPNEIIVVVDGEVGPKLNKAIERYCNHELVIIVKLEKNYGIGYARKIGIENCSTNVFALMDSDDISHNKRFEIQYNELLKGEFDIIGGHIEEFEKKVGDLSFVRKLPLQNDEIYRYGKWRMPVNNVTLMFTRDIYNKVGGYIPLRSGEDWHLVAKWLANNARFHNLDKILVYVRGGSNMIKRRRTSLFQFSQLKVFPYMYKLGYINFFQLTVNVSIRLIINILPASFTSFLYSSFLRKKKKI